MKRQFLTLATASLATLAFAQSHFYVHKTDGTLITYDINEVDSISFDKVVPDSNNLSDNKQQSDSDSNELYVDLGLPSGTLWAKMNVGATSPEQVGDYFSWGETSPKDNYSRSNYKWNGWDIDQLIENGICGSDSTLAPEHDAATVNMGEDWRMPNLQECIELLKACAWSDTTIANNDRETLLFKVTGPNGNYILLPRTGVNNQWDASAYYWTSETSKFYVSDPNDCSYSMFAHNSGSFGYNRNLHQRHTRYDGVPVRAIRKPIKKDADNEQYVDLGLPSGTKWAKMNVGASSPEQIGTYFAWGETAPKDNYSRSNYKWASMEIDELIENGICKTDASVGPHYPLAALSPEHDAATVNMGEDWRMPTVVECNELLKKCAWSDTTIVNEEGKSIQIYKVTGLNGNYILLPRTGLNGYPGSSTYYWSATPSALWYSQPGDCSYSMFVHYISDDPTSRNTHQRHTRYDGAPVRAVRK